METDAVGGAVAPVHIPVTGPLLDGTDGTFPAEGVLRRDLSLDETAAGEAHELRAHLVEHLCQVGAQTVLAVLPCWREEAHHVELQGALAVEDQGEPGLRVVAVGCQLGGVLAPRGPPFVPRGGHNSFSQYRSPLGGRREGFVGFQHGLDITLIFSLEPEAEPVGTSLHGVDAPETFVLQPDGVGRSGVDGHFEGVLLGQFEGVLLGAVQQLYFLGGLHEAGVDGRAVEAVGLPALHVGGSAVARAVLERAVANQLGVEAAVGGVVDVLKKDAIVRGADSGATLVGVDVDGDLGCGDATAYRTGDEESGFLFHSYL